MAGQFKWSGWGGGFKPAPRMTQNPALRQSFSARPEPSSNRPSSPTQNVRRPGGEQRKREEAIRQQTWGQRQQERQLNQQFRQFGAGMSRALDQSRRDPAYRQWLLHNQSRAEREFRMRRAELDNPRLRSLNRKLTHQPRMFEGLHPKDADKFLDVWDPNWGKQKKNDDEALKMYIANRNWRFYQGDPTGTPFPPFAFATNTPYSTSTPSGTPIGQPLVYLDEALSISNFTYYDANGNAVGPVADVIGTLSSERQEAYKTLTDFLNPQGPYKDAWWFQNDNHVTPDELLAVLIFNEGQIDDSVQKVILARYTYYLGSNLQGPSDPENRESVDLYTSRMVRFLEYFEPWREIVPDRFINDQAGEGSLATAQEFLTDPNTYIPGAANWKPDEINRTAGSFIMEGQYNNENGQPVIKTEDGQEVPVVDWSNTPWHFANVGPDGIPEDRISERMKTALIGSGPNQVFDRIKDPISGRVAYVLTPQQAANFCYASVDGFVFTEQDCSK